MTSGKPLQILKIEPENELVFHGPFTQIITVHLKLSNPTEKRVCFKVKTTAPKRYCVRPNSGIIEPQKAADVAVMLQPFEYDPAEKNRHKFMVQCIIPPDDVDNFDQLWKDTPPSSIMDSKLKCVFEAGDSASPAQPEPAKGQQPDVQSGVNDDFVHATQAAHVQSTPTGRTQIGGQAPVSVFGCLRDDMPPVKKCSQSPISVAHTEARTDEVSRLKAELDDLREENQKLKESELRLRKLALSDTVSSNPTPPNTGGVDSASAQAQPSFPPIVYLMIAILVGLIIGKFIL